MNVGHNRHSVRGVVAGLLLGILFLPNAAKGQNPYYEDPYHEKRLLYETAPVIPVPEPFPLKVPPEAREFVSMASQLAAGSKVWLNGSRKRPNTSYYEISPFCEGVISDFFEQKNFTFPLPDFVGDINDPAAKKYWDVVAPRRLDRLIFPHEFDKLSDPEYLNAGLSDEEWENQVRHSVITYSGAVEIYELAMNPEWPAEGQFIIRYTDVCDAEVEGDLASQRECRWDNWWAIHAPVELNWPDFYTKYNGSDGGNYAQSIASQAGLSVRVYKRAVVEHRGRPYLAGVGFTLTRAFGEHVRPNLIDPGTQIHGYFGFSTLGASEGCGVIVAAQGELTIPKRFQEYQE